MIYMEIAWGTLLVSHVFMWYSIKHINRTIELIQDNLKNQQLVNDSTFKTATAIIEGFDRLSLAIKKVADACDVLDKRTSQ